MLFTLKFPFVTGFHRYQGLKLLCLCLCTVNLGRSYLDIFLVKVTLSLVRNPSIYDI